MMKFIYALILIPIALFATYFGYVQYKNSVIAQSEIKQLHKIVELKEKEIDFYQKVNDETTTTK